MLQILLLTPILNWVPISKTDTILLNCCQKGTNIMNYDEIYLIFFLRVFLKIENAAQFTIYFQTEYLIDRTMELRVTDKDNSSTVFASTYAKGKTAMIPSVFLDPNYNNTREPKTLINDIIF